MPTEDMLAKELNVSLATVRQAFKSLEEDGVVERRRRHGTFVCAGFFDRAQLRLLGTVEAFFAHQASETSEVVGHSLIDVPAHLASQFAPLSRVYVFHRVRRQQGVVTSIVTNYVIPELGKKIDVRDLERSPMSKVLRDKLNVRITKIDDTIEARLATPNVAASLGTEPLSPVMLVTGRIFGASNKLLDVAEIYYHAERFKFYVESRIE